jgi:hypothetical protein
MNCVESTPSQSDSVVEWAEVADAARELIVVWCEGSELAWGERAWQILAGAGLTRYANHIDRTRVLLRFVALAMIYRDFCQIGRDESWDASTLVWQAVEVLELSRVRLGQLVGLRWEESTFDLTDDELTEIAILEITDAERSAIVPVLVKGFGNEVALADALCGTTRGVNVDEKETDPGNDGLDGENFTSAARIYEWIDQGMRRL